MSKNGKLEIFPSSEPLREASLGPSPVGFLTATRSLSQGREAAKRTLDPGENLGNLFQRRADSVTGCIYKINSPNDRLVPPTTNAGEPKK